MVSRFTAAQKAYLNAYYSQGMKGTGRQYKNIIQRAAADTGLSSAQIKVCNLNCNIPSKVAITTHCSDGLKGIIIEGIMESQLLY